MTSKLIRKDTCYGTSLELDGEVPTDEQIKDILISKINTFEPEEIAQIMDFILNSYPDDFQNLGTCDQCGHSCYSHTLIIEK